VREPAGDWRSDGQCGTRRGAVRRGCRSRRARVRHPLRPWASDDSRSFGGREHDRRAGRGGGPSPTGRV